jgi:hypothetical protein
LSKIVTAAGQVKSHKLASEVLDVVGEIEISGRHVNRLTEIIGLELAARRDQETEDYVHHRRHSPTVPAPQVVAVGLDGGRIMTRESGQGPGVHKQKWKEDKVACLLTFEGEMFAEDPHPEPPRCFLDAPRVDEMVREIQAHHGPRQENELPQLAELGLGKPASAVSQPVASEAEPDAEQMVEAKPAWPPKRTKNSRTCVATMQDCAAFGMMVAAESYRRNFQAASRGALLGDGSAWIWGLHDKWFRWLTAITDFVHPLTYLYVTATVLAKSVAERWEQYVAWMTLCWKGRVQDVISDMQERLDRLGAYPGPGTPPATDAREVLRRTMTYLQNNQDRMNYVEYRKQGLPITSSMVESLIKEMNYRVKGTEKFWDRPDLADDQPEGGEAILQVRAALLSDDDRLQRHLESRPGSAFRRHTNRKVGKAA